MKRELNLRLFSTAIIVNLVPMNTTELIARRYLFSKKHISLISTLTGISILGVTIGTALLIVVLSVFNGFFDVIKGLLLQNDPDIRIESVEGRTLLMTDDLRTKLGDIPDITTASPFVSGKALLAHRRNREQVVPVMGIDPGEYLAINNIERNVTSGNVDLGVYNGKPGMLISEQLMSEMRMSVGDEVVLLSAEGMRKSLTQFSLPRTYRFEIRGAYSRMQIVEGPAVFIEQEAAQRLFNMNRRVSGIDLRLKDPDKADRVKETLQAGLGAGYKISTWYDLQKPLYDIMYLEKWSSYVILMIIVLVAVLNIVGSLTMIVIQKNRDIGVLLTLGFTPEKIKQVFVRQGLYIGLIGCGIGGGLGLLLGWLQKEYGLIKLSSAFIIEAYPVSINFLDVSIILAGSLLLCVAASWYPARRASSVDPADAVRFD